MASSSFPSALHASAVTVARSRAIYAEELQAIPWLGTLTAEERDRATDDLRVVQVAPGELVCRVGRPVTYWFGVLEHQAGEGGLHRCVSSAERVLQGAAGRSGLGPRAGSVTALCEGL